MHLFKEKVLGGLHAKREGKTMQNYDIFSDIAERTGGDIYFGIVGPVRTGKSTFIKRFMELLVLPNIVNVFERERARDELPQSGAGKRITTTEPKFIPSEAVEVILKDTIKMNVRLVDCVGYAVEGAIGYEDGDDDQPRMIHTPWNDDAIPFEEAAELGTRKVIADHSTLGIVLTTDGSISEIPRENYVEAEQRVITELQEIGKPFIIVLNTTRPFAENTLELCRSMGETYKVPVIPVDCMEINISDITQILEEMLYEFPVDEVNIELPKWVEELEHANRVRLSFDEAIQNAVSEIKRIRDIDHALDVLSECPYAKDVILRQTDLGTGKAEIEIFTDPELYKEILEELTGIFIEGEHTIMRMIMDYSKAKKEWDKLSKAFEEVHTNGYGVVTPQLEEMFLEEPELVKSGGHYGIKLKASAPSLHILRADVTTEITPLIGTEKQAEELVNIFLMNLKKTRKKSGILIFLANLCMIWSEKASRISFIKFQKMFRLNFRILCRG
jgi:stage IV sporulation protein A